MNSPLRMVTSTLAAGALAAVAFTAAPASAASRCGVTYLPLPAEAVPYNTWVNGADVTGRWAVGSTEIDRSTEQVIWQDGKVSLPSLPFGQGGLADVNTSGLAVGYGLTSNYLSVPVAWSESTGLRELPVPHEGWAAEATGINSRGDIVGTAHVAGEHDNRYAVRWPAGAPGTVEVMPGDGPHAALGVDEDGTVLVQKGAIGVPGPAVVWDPADGDVESLGEDTFGTAISGGYVIGHQNDGNDQKRMLWNLRGPDREILDIDIVSAVNKQGTIAGQAEFIKRRNGTRIALESPAGYPYVSELSDTGVAYGSSGGKPARWIDCR
jgi:hypothetical protein